MFSHFGSFLRKLEDATEGFESERFRDQLQFLPIELWGQIASRSEAVAQYERLRSLTPDMPPLEIQARFVGGSGEALLPRNANFIRVFDAGVSAALGRPLRNIRVLDYGCGWARMSRYFLRYCAPGDLVSADPDKGMIDMLTEQKFPSDVRLIPAVPTDDMDVGDRFDVVNLYSVFTHLPDWLVIKVMDFLSRVIRPNGVVVFTVRPPEFWPYYHGHTKDDSFAGCAEEHAKSGYAFVPQVGVNWGVGTPTYGDASFSLGNLRQMLPDWSFVKTDIVPNDPMQIIYFAVPKPSVAVRRGSQR